MATEPKIVETNRVNDTSEHKNISVQVSPDTVAHRNGEQSRSVREKPRYKNIPEDWKAIPAARFRKVIEDIEAVLLEISVDGKVTSNPFDWKPAIPTLQAWANHLKSALKELTK